MSRLKTLAFVPVLMLAVPQPAAAQPAPIAQVTAHLQAVDTMTANFSQTDRRGQVLNGVLTLKRPGRLRFQYQPGVPMLVVADGKRLWVIDYETKRRDSWPIGNSPLGILLNANPDLTRIAKVVRNDAQILMVEARDPKKPQYGTITLGFSKTASAPAGLLLQGWTVIDAQNNRTTVRLSNQRFNAAVADSAFRFDDPRRRGPKG
ncbi:MAG: outer rane lipoprotein carrier protein LolA [Alphaproteobacteria bacterium]|nr:outer rane lipoprotein carrier protein LolA [Alphaproteobacteria bacterium]